MSVLSVGLGILVPFSTLLLQSLTFLGSICLRVVLILAGVWGFSPKEGLNEGNCMFGQFLLAGKLKLQLLLAGGHTWLGHMV